MGEFLVYKIRECHINSSFPRKGDFVCQRDNEYNEAHSLKCLARRVSTEERVLSDFRFGIFTGKIFTDFTFEHNRVYANGTNYIQESVVNPEELAKFHKFLLDYLKKSN
jgi:hypothetical protein